MVLVTLGAAILSAALLLFPREDERPATAAAAAEVSPHRGLRGRAGPGVTGRFLRDGPHGCPEAPGMGPYLRMWPRDGPLPQDWL